MKPILLMTTLLWAACGSQNQKAAPEPEGDEGPAIYEMNYQDVMEFTRGVQGSYLIEGRFKNEDATTITIDGLPDGAVYDDSHLKWTPPCSLSPENGQFARGYQVYRLRISMAGVRSDNLVQRPAILLVHLTGEDSTCEE